MVTPRASMKDLPAELLILTLEPLDTATLLSILCTSKSIFSASSTVLHRRLRRAVALPELRVILECYHEGIRLSAPTLTCRYVKTTDDCAFPDRWRRDGGGTVGAARGKYVDNAGDPWRWHTWFDVRLRSVEAQTWMRPRRTTPTTPPPCSADNDGGQEEEIPDIDINLGESEDEVDLIARPIIERDAKPGVFVTHAPVCEASLKVTREWLAETSGPVKDGVVPRRADEDRRVLWSGPGREVGIRFHARAEAAERMPVLVGMDDRPPVGYTLQYDGMVIRSMLLLRAVEQVFSTRTEVGGKALVLLISG